MPVRRGQKNPRSIIFLDSVLSPFALQGPLCFPVSGLAALLPRDRRRATACMYTPGRPSLVDMAAQASSSASPSNMSVTSVLSPGPPPTPPPTLTAISKSPLESKASLPRSTCREDSLPLAVFYGPLDAKNPLLASFEKEIQELLGFMKRKKALATTEKQNHEFHRRW